MFIKLFSAIRKKFHKVDTNIKPLEESELREKEQQMFGQDALYYQKLFEKWTVKDEWCLASEGILLLLGIDPAQGLNEDDVELYHKHNDLLAHARQCAEQGLLTIVNQTENQEDWKVVPVDLYRWASISRVELRQEFIHLMDFVTKMTAVPANTFVSSKAEATIDEKAIAILEDKTIVLGAALSILFHRREECLNSKGKLRQEKIVPLIQADLTKWFADKTPNLNEQAMQDLVRQYISSS